ncbi:MAG: AI-2E family transporter [Bacteroidales bacterium]|nr:AI-2E family transporter [Bacteroidales bacterium]
MVLSLIGKPLVDFLDRLHIKKIKLPRWSSALFTLIFLWVVFFTFFRIFIPLIANEASDLSETNINGLLVSFQGPLNEIENFIEKFNISGTFDISLSEILANKFFNLVNYTLITDFISSLASLLGNIFIAVFSISFITFFFLKDEKMFEEGVLLFVHDKHEVAVKRALDSTRRLLMRYFIGICLQITGIIILVTAGLTLIGVGFRHSLVIGLLAGVVNIVPYIGPMVGSILGTLLGIATHINLDFNAQLFPMIIGMVIVFIVVHIIDNIFFQPLIYSSSVNAHPLEIFLVIMIAGSLAGVTGMILAVPSYTVLRVFAKEFFNRFKLVQKITERID